MNNACCKPTMTVVGVRAAALGSRGLLLFQRQCRPMMKSKCYPLPLAVQPRLPHLCWPAEARSSQRSLRRPSLLTLQCSLQEPFPAATAFVLLNTKEFADGSIMYNFGTSEQHVTEKATKQSTKNVANGANSTNLQATKEAFLETAKQDPESAQGETIVEEASGSALAGNESSIADTEVATDVEDVPNSADLSDMAHGAEELAQELNEEDDKLKAQESSNSNDQLLSEPTDKATAENNGSSKVASPIGGDGHDSSGLGVKEKDPNQDFVFNSAAAMIPHPDKAKTGGEDAYFMDGKHWVGVADGVGGWALSGVDAGHYARELMWNCAERARKVGSHSDPKAVLVYAAKKTKAKGTAATLIASLYDQTLRVANIGDSGFVVVRDTSIVARSQAMVRGFNFPYQIGTDGDDPKMAEVYDFPVQKNDVVILASDGVFDNLFEEQIIAIIGSVQKAGGGPEVVAKELVALAQKVGATKQGMSPFAVAAHGAGYASYFGGKLDDTTAVVAYVV